VRNDARFGPRRALWFRRLLRCVPVGPDDSARVGARQIYILPTSTGLWYATAVMVMFIGSLNYQNNLGLLFAFFLIAVGITAMHHCWFNLLGLTVTVRPGPPVFAGDITTFEVVIRNETTRSRYDLRLGGLPEGLLAVCLEGLEQRILPCGRPTRRRGWLQLHQVTLETRHPMRLFRAWCYVGTRAVALVYPNPASLAPPLETFGGGSVSASPASGNGRDDYLGPRPYHRGDSPRHLDWKALARERGLIVKQFGAEGGQDLWIDWAQLATPDAEIRISLLARQVLEAATANLRFGLRLPGVEVALGHGEAHYGSCLKELALWKPAGQTGSGSRCEGEDSGTIDAQVHDM
jgi:uncharacterized protein (DUF58 family)